MEALTHIITSVGFIAVLIVIYAESGLLIGFLLPGDSLLFTAGYLVLLGNGAFAINIHLFVLLLWIAAVLGDNTGYLFGKRVGRKLFQRKNSRFFKQEYLVRAEAFFKKHGPIAIVLARFVPVVRTFTPIVAGSGKMRYRTFFTYNIIGGFLWVALFTYAGYLIGEKLQSMGINVELVALGVIALSLAPIALHFLLSKRKRKALLRSIKQKILAITQPNDHEPKTHK
ncbi:VTT domain-containing protein [Candidatus Saccharibacteria bacterium]|nr:VTT domain-containing protein [Candidatus Saccharibacteria bacterium]